MWYNSFIHFVFFVLSLILIIFSIIFVIGVLFSLSAKAKQEITKGKLQIQKIGDDYKKLKNKILENVLDKKQFKKLLKEQKKDSYNNNSKNKIYVINFKGDMFASQVECLRQEISAILYSATKNDEVIVRIESPGGVVNGYGFAAAQLERIRNKSGLKLTICIDQIAASGGYMMAVVAHKIISAPYAIIGSIGVVGTVPNIHNLLAKNGINVETHTSGQFKRTLTTMGENTEKGREKFKQDLNDIHDLFKNHIINYRPSLNIQKVGTGEYWFGINALKLGLVDKIQTYDDYIIQHLNNNLDVYQIQFIIKNEKWLFSSKLAIIKKTITSFLSSQKII